MAADISDIDHKRYTLTVGFVAFLLLVLTAAVNIAIDPYLRFGTKPIPNLSVLKPAAIGQVRMAKAYGVVRRDFNTLLLGNSRVDVGIDPRRPGISQEQAPVYNLGQPGTGSETALAYLKHAADNHRPVMVLMGVDFLSYLQPRNRAASNTKNLNHTPDFVRLNLHNPEVPWWRRRLQPVNDTLTAALSLSSLQATVRTVWAQSNKNSASIDALGFNSGDAFRDLISAEGQASLFDQKNREYIERNLQRVAPEFAASAEMRAVEEVLDYCRQGGIQLRVFIHAYHVDVLEIIYETGHWSAFERWKHELVELCHKYDIPLWDFAQVNAWTTEEPPQHNDRTTIMKWYWESGHYRSDLGKLMVMEMLAEQESDSSATAASVGTRLTVQNVEQHLDAVEKRLAEYRLSPTPHQVELKELCEKLRLR